MSFSDFFSALLILAPIVAGASAFYVMSGTLKARSNVSAELSQRLPTHSDDSPIDEMAGAVGWNAQQLAALLKAHQLRHERTENKLSYELRNIRDELVTYQTHLASEAASVRGELEWLHATVRVVAERAADTEESLRELQLVVRNRTGFTELELRLATARAEIEDFRAMMSNAISQPAEEIAETH